MRFGLSTSNLGSSYICRGVWRQTSAGLTQTGHVTVVRGRGAGWGRAFGVGLDEVDSLAVCAAFGL